MMCLLAIATIVLSLTDKLSASTVPAPGKMVMWTNSVERGIQQQQQQQQQIYDTKTTLISDLSERVQNQCEQYDVVVFLTSTDENILALEPVQQSTQQSPSARFMTNIYSSSAGDSISAAILDASSKNIAATDMSVAELKATLAGGISASTEQQPASPSMYVVSVRKEDVASGLLQETLSQTADAVAKVLFIAHQEVSSSTATAAIPPPGYYNDVISSVSKSRFLSAYRRNKNSARHQAVASGRHLSADSTEDDTTDCTPELANTFGTKCYLPEGSEYSIYYADTYLYITPDIFTGIMTGLFFVFVAMLGLSCMNGIQGMSSFYDRVPSVGKEA